ncbi:MAG: hypothetical protein WBA99_06490 [Nodosilinea sp.]
MGDEQRESAIAILNALQQELKVRLRVAESARRRMAVELLLGHPVVGFGVITQRPQIAIAEKAVV